MRSFLLGLAALILAAPSVGAQTPIVFVTQSVRDTLAAAWSDTNVAQVERGYCARYRYMGTYEGVPRYVVHDIERPTVTLYATPVSVLFRCPTADPTVFVHTHPAATCTQLGRNLIACERGGLGAHQCFPSPQDRRVLDRTGHPFALVQCDAQALVPYGPTPKKFGMVGRKVIGLSLSLIAFTAGAAHIWFSRR
jgi:hypothetical protein